MCIEYHSCGTICFTFSFVSYIHPKRYLWTTIKEWILHKINQLQNIYVSSNKLSDLYISPNLGLDQRFGPALCLNFKPDFSQVLKGSGLNHGLELDLSIATHLFSNFCAPMVV